MHRVAVAALTSFSTRWVLGSVPIISRRIRAFNEDDLDLIGMPYDMIVRQDRPLGQTISP